MVSKKKVPVDFEKSLKELNTLVDTMEKGELSLEDAMQHFERGIHLTQECQQALQQAEQKVKILTKENKHVSLQDFDADS